MKRMLAGRCRCGVMLMTTTAACGGSSRRAATAGRRPVRWPSISAAAGVSAAEDGGLAISSGSTGDTEQQQQVQELVVACMKEAGFEYLPYVPTLPNSNRWWRATPTGRAPTATASPPSMRSAPTPSDDPNTAITDAMSEAERAAYHQALFGSVGGNAGDGPAAGSLSRRPRLRAHAPGRGAGTQPRAADRRRCRELTRVLPAGLRAGLRRAGSR